MKRLTFTIAAALLVSACCDGRYQVTSSEGVVYRLDASTGEVVAARHLIDGGETAVALIAGSHKAKK